MRALIDSAPLLQVGKGKTASRDKMAIVQQFVALAVDEDAPIPRHALTSWTLGTDAGGAMVVTALYQRGRGTQHVQYIQVFEKSRTVLRRRGQSVVEINVFAGAIVCSDANKVAFVPNDVNQFVLTKEGLAVRNNFRLILFASRWKSRCHRYRIEN